MDGVLYVMYVVGRELGICDQYNLCKGDITEVTEYAKEILEHEIKPSFGSKSAPVVSQNLSRHLLDGVHILNPFINQDGFM